MTQGTHKNQRCQTNSTARMTSIQYRIIHCENHSLSLPGEDSRVNGIQCKPVNQGVISESRNPLISSWGTNRIERNTYFEYPVRRPRRKKQSAPAVSTSVATPRPSDNVPINYPTTTLHLINSAPFVVREDGDLAVP